jgi:hypothetical protein
MLMLTGFRRSICGNIAMLIASFHPPIGSGPPFRYVATNGRFAPQAVAPKSSFKTHSSL